MSKSDDKRFYTQMRIAGANIEAAKEHSERGFNREAHADLDNCQRNLLQAQLETQIAIEKRGGQPKGI